MKLAYEGISIHVGTGDDGPREQALRLVVHRLSALSAAPAVPGTPRIRRDLAEDSAMILCGADSPDAARMLRERPRTLPDGFCIRALPKDKSFALTAENGRGLLYAARRFTTTVRETSDGLEWDEEVRESPAYEIRSWLYYGVASSVDTVCRDVLPSLAQDFRLNTVMYGTFAKGTVGPQVFLDDAFPGRARPFREHAAKILAEREDLHRFITASRAQGLAVYAGWDLMDFPEYVFEHIVEHHSELLARGFKGSSDWPPYEWQERPKYCPSQPGLWKIWQSALEEFFSVHPELSGLALSFYDGNPLGCGCARCASYSYGPRYRDAIIRTNETVQALGKRLVIFDWLPGGLSARPGYNSFWDDSFEYIDAHENIIMATWETAGDFCMGHPPHPQIGRYRNQIAGFQLWPEYRGWGKVPDWIVRHMSDRVRLFQQKKLKGFFAVEGNLEDRINAVNFRAYGELCWNPDADPVVIEKTFCEREFGRGGAALAPILARSWDCKKDYLYVRDVKFNGHSHLEYDLRTWESVYVRYDSGAFFPDLEQRVDLQSIQGIVAEKDRGVSTAEEMLLDFRAIEDRFSKPDRDLITGHLERNLHYGRLWRGFTKAFFALKALSALQPDSAQRERMLDSLRTGGEEMRDANARLPASSGDSRHVYYDQGFPWSSPDLGALIDDIEAAYGICRWCESETDLAVLGAGASSEYLRQLFLRHDVPAEAEADQALNKSRAVVIDRYATAFFNANSARLMSFVEAGGAVLLNDPDCASLDASRLPGQISFNVCQHASAKVVDRGHPIMRGYRDVGRSPISYFGSTSAYMEGGPGGGPPLRWYGVCNNAWSALTYPGMFFETAVGKGALIGSLLGDNRSVYLRTLACLLSRQRP